MKWLTFKVQQEPGFRFNLIDLVFILALLCLSFAAKVAAPDLSLYAIPIYLGCTFFQFCNVFRISHRTEALWYAPFAAIAMGAVYTLRFAEFWWAVLFFFEPLKFVLVRQAMMAATYHGAFHRWALEKYGENE